jgi:hypothetical protein
MQFFSKQIINHVSRNHLFCEKKNTKSSKYFLKNKIKNLHFLETGCKKAIKSKSDKRHHIFLYSYIILSLFRRNLFIGILLKNEQKKIDYLFTDGNLKMYVMLCHKFQVNWISFSRSPSKFWHDLDKEEIWCLNYGVWASWSFVCPLLIFRFFWDK